MPFIRTWGLLWWQIRCVEVGRSVGCASQRSKSEIPAWNFSVNKDTALRFLGEAGKVQFRAEMFNILNHPNFGPTQNGGFLSGSVRDTVEQPAFTGIIATSTPGRQIQFSLKILF